MSALYYFAAWRLFRERLELNVAKCNYKYTRIILGGDLL